MLKKLENLSSCLNCGYSDVRKFCPECGQANQDRRASVKSLLSDFIADVFSFDSKLFRTLKCLVLRPGFLTNEYNEGHRISYLSPVKLYLTASVIFFLLLAYKAKNNIISINSSTTSDAWTNASRNGTGKPVKIAPVTTNQNSGIKLDPEMMKQTEASYLAKQKTLPVAKRDSWFASLMVRQAIRVKDDPNRFQAKLMDNAPKAMFLIMPIFAFLLKLAYIRRSRFYVEHLIFALHCHAFVFLILAATYLLNIFLLKLVSVVWILIYLYISMLRVYQQGKLKTAVKYVAIQFVYSVLLSIVMIIVILASLMMV